MPQTRETNRRFVLAQRPNGEPDAATLRIENTDVPIPQSGQMLLRTQYLSLDPYMRGRMSDAPSYAAPVKIDAVMVGATVALVVAAATGPVGATVGQIGKLKGCRVVAIAGGSEKCAYAVNSLGFDACIDHKSEDFARQLLAAVANGIDVYFENVGGKVFDAVLPLLNPQARVPVCGLVSQYNATRLPDGPDRINLLMGLILRRRITMRGFIIFEDFGKLYPQFAKEMAAWVEAGKIRYREDIVDGLEQAPQAFIGLLKGENFGKRIIRVGPAG